MTLGPRLTTTVDRLEGTTCVHVTGEIDMTTSAGLSDTLLQAIDTSDRVELDLSGVSFMDSYGLRVLVSIHGVVPDGNGTFQVVGASPHVQGTFALTGLDFAYGWPSDRKRSALASENDDNDNYNYNYDEG